MVSIKMIPSSRAITAMAEQPLSTSRLLEEEEEKEEAESPPSSSLESGTGGT